jgi:hypothetical protein
LPMYQRTSKLLFYSLKYQFITIKRVKRNNCVG